MTTTFDLAEVDKLLTTTRAVRRRLDLERDVPDDVLLDCIRLSQQAPTGSNQQNWRWIVVRDAAKRTRLADIYREFGREYLARQAERMPEGQTRRVMSSAVYLADNLHRVPVHVIPCLKAEHPQDTSLLAWSSLLGSIYPAVWSFQLALRSRGLGSCLTTLHLGHTAAVAELLEIPDDVLQIGLLPVAYTVGTDFNPAERRPPEHITHFDTWGNKQT